MRITVTLDDDVLEAAHRRSQASGKPLGQVISEMARHALRAPIARRSSRFPAFDVSAEAPPIPASRIQSFLDDDGVV